MKNKKVNNPESSKINHQYYKDGCKLFDSQQFQKAIVAFREALEYWPEDAQAWIALGNCYSEIKKPHKAEMCFSKALEFAQPKDREKIIYNLGNSLFDQKRFGEAIKYYEKIVSGSPLWLKAQRTLKLAEDKL